MADEFTKLMLTRLHSQERRSRILSIAVGVMGVALLASFFLGSRAATTDPSLVARRITIVNDKNERAIVMGVDDDVPFLEINDRSGQIRMTMFGGPHLTLASSGTGGIEMTSSDSRAHVFVRGKDSVTMVFADANKTGLEADIKESQVILESTVADPGISVYGPGFSGQFPARQPGK